MESSSFGALTDPAHPDHALYRQASARVAQIDVSLGRTSDASSHRLAAGVTLLAAEQGMQRVDRLELSKGRSGLPDGERVIVWQGAVGDVDYRLASGKTDELLAMSGQDIAEGVAAARAAQDHAPSRQINDVAQERQASVAWA